MSEKQCIKCKEVRPLDEFHRDRGRKDGRYGYCKPCSRAHARSWYTKSPANRDKGRKRSRQWHAVNSERSAELLARWRVENPDGVRAHRRNRRARLYGAEGVIDRGLQNDMFKEQKGRCFYCDRVLDRHCDRLLDHKANIEHLIPLSRGGSNLRENLAWACRKCNFEKSNKTWRELLMPGYIDTDHPRLAPLEEPELTY